MPITFLHNAKLHKISLVVIDITTICSVHTVVTAVSISLEIPLCYQAVCQCCQSDSVLTIALTYQDYFCWGLVPSDNTTPASLISLGLF